MVQPKLFTYRWTGSAQKQRVGDEAGSQLTTSASSPHGAKSQVFGADEGAEAIIAAPPTAAPAHNCLSFWRVLATCRRSTRGQSLGWACRKIAAK